MEEKKLEILRHSASHIMAQAVKNLYPNVKLGIGPAIENGFYYDFDLEKAVSDDDLNIIEAEIRKIIKADLKFERQVLKKKEAAALFKKNNEPYKAELIKEIEAEEVTIYRQGNFVDLCKGPHLSSTGEVKFFKLLKTAGAYWRGSEKNKMLQRIYGVAFEKEEDLNNHLKLLEEAQKRDHRYLGVSLDLFSFHDKIGAGLVLYHPKGAVVRTIIEDYLKKEHIKRNYQLVISPHIMKSDIWQCSGHYDFYKENMYIFEIDNQEFALKPMNCPGHMLIYAGKIRSYKDLPIRFFELGTVYRHEKSGVLHGLLRVRGFTQDDAHIFCLPEQLESEISNIIDFVIETMEVFGFEKIEVSLSTRPEKYIGHKEDWQQAVNSLKNVLVKREISFAIHEGEGAFYGPKIDIELKDALGRTWQCATIQCDFALPQKFNLSYIDNSGKPQKPVMLHRVIVGSLERFIGCLIEHYGGAFPVWLSPVQVKIIPVSEKQHSETENLLKKLREDDIRAEMDVRNEKVNYKIREAVLAKIPYMVVVGEKEIKEETLSVRCERDENKGVLRQMNLASFVRQVKEDIQNKNR